MIFPIWTEAESVKFGTFLWFLTMPFISGVIKTLSYFMLCTFQMSQKEIHLDEHARPKIYNFQIPYLTPKVKLKL